jgi:O-antigen ligase
VLGLVCAAAALAGREVAHGKGVAITLVLAASAFLVLVLTRPEHAALGVIVVLPFTFYPVSVGGFSAFIAVPMVACVSVALLLTQHGSLRRLRWRLSLSTFGVLLLAALVATAHSTDTSTAGSRVLYIVVFALFAWALAASITAGRLTVQAVATAVVISAAIASVALITQVVVQFAVGQPAVRTWLAGEFQLFGGLRGAGVVEQTQNWVVGSINIVRGIFPFMAAPSAGQYTMMGLVAAVWLWRERRGKPGRALLLLAIVLIAVGLLSTFSRQAWVGMFAGLGALALRRNPLKPVMVILLVFVLLSVTPIPGGHSTFGDYLLTASDTTSVSSATRLDLWSQAIHLLPGHWLVGVGPGLYQTLNPDPQKAVYYAHNVWLDELVELGLAGGIALIAVFVLAMRSAFRRGATLGFALLAAFVVANLFDDVLYFPRNGILLAVAFALAAAGGGARLKRPAVPG